MKRLFRIKMRGGALIAIAALMLMSAAVRLGFEAGPALAREAETKMAVDVKEPAAPAKTEMMKPEEDVGALLSALKMREEKLVQREIELEDRMQALDIANRAIDDRMAALVEAEKALRETLALADGAAERDLASLTTVYENMKPKDAAALFEEMAPEFAAGFLGRMRPEIAAGVIAGLSPESAYSISVILAGRNSAAPTE